MRAGCSIRDELLFAPDRGTTHTPAGERDPRIQTFPPNVATPCGPCQMGVHGQSGFFFPFYDSYAVSGPQLGRHATSRQRE
jgi:hypothetical protein